MEEIKKKVIIQIKALKVLNNYKNYFKAEYKNDDQGEWIKENAPSSGPLNPIRMMKTVPQWRPNDTEELAKKMIIEDPTVLISGQAGVQKWVSERVELRRSEEIPMLIDRVFNVLKRWGADENSPLLGQPEDEDLEVHFDKYFPFFVCCMLHFSGGVAVKDRRYHLRSYPLVIVAEEL